MRLATAHDWDARASKRDCELVDGLVRPRVAPTARHTAVKARLVRIFTSLAPRGLVVLVDAEVRLAELHRRRPDIVVVWLDDPRAAELGEDAAGVSAGAGANGGDGGHGVGLDGPLMPEQVVVAIEVVSAGSETTDRRYKPIDYAEAEINHYWRVETTPCISVHTFRLGEGCHYLETGLFRDGDWVSDPTLRWASFDMTHLLRG